MHNNGNARVNSSFKVKSIAPSIAGINSSSQANLTQGKSKLDDSKRQISAPK